MSRIKEPWEPWPLAISLGAGLLLIPAALAFRIDWDRAIPILWLPALLINVVTPTTTSPKTIADRMGIWSLVIAGIALAISIVQSEHVARAMATGSSWVIITAGGVAACKLVKDKNSVMIVALGAALGALAGLFSTRLLMQPTSISPPLYGHVRLMGLHMMLGALASAIVLISIRRNNPIFRGFSILLTGLLCGGVWWSGGRAPLLGLAIGLTTWFIVSPNDRRKSTICLLPILVLIAGVTAWAMGTPIQGLGWSFAFGRTVQASNIEQLTSDRTIIWETVTENIFQAPWLGHGPDAYLFFRPMLGGAQPHNFILQWMLDLGFIGTAALLVLLAQRFYLVIAKHNNSNELNRAAIACLSATIAAGLFDGIFYHAMLFMCTAIFAALCTVPPKQTSSKNINFKHQYIRLVNGVIITLAALVLGINSWLFHRLRYNPPASPQTFAAKVLRVFPSNVHGLWTWLDLWKRSDANVAIEWAMWAQTYSINPELFRIYTARCYLENGDFKNSEAQLKYALAEIDPARRISIEKMINEVRRRKDASTAPSPKSISNIQ